MKTLETLAFAAGIFMVIVLFVTLVHALNVLSQEPVLEQKRVPAFDGKATCEVFTYGESMNVICTANPQPVQRRPLNEAIYYQRRF